MSWEYGGVEAVESVAKAILYLADKIVEAAKILKEKEKIEVQEI